MDTRSLLIRADDQPGVLHRITGEIVAAGGNIVTVETREATRGVFSLIAVAMTIVVISIGGWGPRTLNRELEEISQ